MVELSHIFDPILTLNMDWETWPKTAGEALEDSIIQSLGQVWALRAIKMLPLSH